MPAETPDVDAGRSAALTAEEAHALALAAELRDRIQRERETAQLLGAYLQVNGADADSPLPGDSPAAPGGPPDPPTR